MARRIGREHPNVWRGQKFKASTDAERQGIYGDAHLNAFEMGARRMRDPSTFYRQKFFERTGKVPKHVPSDFAEGMRGLKGATRRGNLATIGAVAVGRNLAVRAHPALAMVHMAAFGMGKGRYLQGRKAHVQDIMERETKKKQNKAVFGGYYERTVNGKRERVRKARRQVV